MAEESLFLRIEGMTCDGCAQTIRRYLKHDKGVKDVRIEWRSGTADVSFDPEVTDQGKILGNRVFQGGYRTKPA